MTKKSQKLWALDEAIKITHSYCSGGNPSLSPETVIQMCYKKLFELKDDIEKED
jgi:hypothetical protein